MSNIYRRLLGNNQVKESKKISDVFKNWQDKETWLFVAPHDDDIVIGAGKTLLAAISEGVDVHAAITTDGSAGYCDLAVKDTIAQVREKECFNSFLTLGVAKEKISFLHFPDCQLFSFRGRTLNVTGHPSETANASGLQNSYVSLLRRVKPTRVFMPTSTDLHPDHKIVNEELLISIFHAEGTIWPELGEPLPSFPTIYEYATYSDYPSPPQIGIEISNELLEKKWEAIRAYKSQTQIETLIDEQKKDGAFEFIREIEFKLYSAEKYKKLFLAK